MAMPAFLTTKEVAALLRIKERKVYELVAAQAIPVSLTAGGARPGAPRDRR